MNEHEQLRGALATLTADQPVPADRVGEVRGRIRRRARRRAAGVTSLVLVAGVGAAALLTPGGAGGKALPPAVPAVSTSPGPAPVPDATVRELEVRMTEVSVELPGRSYAEQLRLVQAQLEAGPDGLPTYLLRKTTEFGFDWVPGPGAPDPDRDRVGVHVTFLERLTRQQSAQLELGKPGGGADQGWATGWDLELVTPLPAPVPAELARALAEDRLPPAQLTALLEPLDGTVGVRLDDAGQLVVHYRGLALSPEDLSSAKAQVAQLVGVGADQVRLRASRR